MQNKNIVAARENIKKNQIATYSKKVYYDQWFAPLIQIA